MDRLRGASLRFLSAPTAAPGRIARGVARELPRGSEVGAKVEEIARECLSQNMVKFGKYCATVKSATTSKLTVTIPTKLKTPG